jgi:hypothetical protein
VVGCSSTYADSDLKGEGVFPSRMKTHTHTHTCVDINTPHTRCLLTSIHKFTYTHTHIHTHAYTHTHTHTQTHTHTHTHRITRRTISYACIETYVHSHMYTSMHSRVHSYVEAHAYTHTAAFIIADQEQHLISRHPGKTKYGRRSWCYSDPFCIKCVSARVVTNTRISDSLLFAPTVVTLVS